MTSARWRAVWLLLLAWAFAQSLLTVRVAVRHVPESDFLETVPPAFLNAPPDLFENFPYSIRSDTYLRGPSQYVTIVPLTFAGSAAAIERILLPIYGVCIVGAALLSRRTLERVSVRSLAWLPFVAATVAFPPVQHALVDREFEIVILLAFAAAMRAVVADRFYGAGALLAYISLYKYLTLIVLPYLVARRWWKSLAAFAITAAAIVLLMHVVYGLEGFRNSNVRIKAAELVTGLWTPAFCAPTEVQLNMPPDLGDESIRNDLCDIGASIGVSPQLLYFTVLVLTGGVFAFGFIRLERVNHERTAAVESWRRVFELSVLATVAMTFFFTHYYYLSLLILPIHVLFVRFTPAARWHTPGLTLLAASYFLTGCFLLRPGLFHDVVGLDLGSLARQTQALFAGEMLLLGLLLHQYVTLPIGPAPAAERV